MFATERIAYLLYHIREKSQNIFLWIDKKIVKFLNDVKQDVLKNIPTFLEEDKDNQKDQNTTAPQMKKADPCLNYRVNLFIDNSKKNYLELYNLAMFVSRNSNPKREQIIHEPIKKEVEEKNDIVSPTTEELEQEQIRWF